MPTAFDITAPTRRALGPLETALAIRATTTKRARADARIAAPKPANARHSTLSLRAPPTPSPKRNLRIMASRGNRRFLPTLRASAKFPNRRNKRRAAVARARSVRTSAAPDRAPRSASESCRRLRPPEAPVRFDAPHFAAANSRRAETIKLRRSRFARPNSAAARDRARLRQPARPPRARWRWFRPSSRHRRR